MGLPQNGFKALILNILKKLKETMYKEPKETMTMMSSKRETLSEEIESIKRKQTEILELIHSK